MHLHAECGTQPQSLVIYSHADVVSFFCSLLVPFAFKVLSTLYGAKGMFHSLQGVKSAFNYLGSKIFFLLAHMSRKLFFIP